MDQGFFTSTADSSLFVKHCGDQLLILLLHVDDMLVTCSSSSLLSDFLFVLKTEYAMTDLGFVHCFLGVEVTKTPSGLYLSQQRYIQQLFVKDKMVDCKPIATPIVALDVIP